MEKRASDTLRSKRFWSALIGLLTILITGVAPDLKEHIGVIVPGVLGIVGLLIGGYTAQDVAREKYNPTMPPVESVNQVVFDVDSKQGSNTAA